MLKVANSVINVSQITGTLPTTNGGTGLTSFTVNGVVYASSTSALATSSAATFDGTNFATTGTATASRFIPTGSTVATNGLYLPAANSIGLSTNSTNAVYVDSTQNVMVGKTSAATTSLVGTVVTSVGRINVVTAASTSAFSTYELYSTGAGAYRFYVDASGTISATSIVITAISDQRLKENVRDIDTGLNSIMALKPRRFDWKEGKGQDKKNVAGFIAQEFEDVFPESVGASKAGGDGIEYKNINHETLIPTLVKAIQELKAEFDAYKATRR